jgi:hypothetical protein
MNSDQKVIIKNWICAGIFLVVLASTLLLPADQRLSAGLFSGVVLIVMLLFNPDFRRWTGYGPKGVRLGEYLQEHTLLQIWMVFVCAFVLPFLIYRIYTSGGDGWGLYGVCFGLLIGPVFVTSEIERYRAAGQEGLTSSGTRTR